MTPQEEAEAEAAAKAAEGYIAAFIPEVDQVALVTLVINAADGSADQSIDGRFNAGKAALLQAEAETGHAGQAPDQTVSAVVDAILNAVAALRPASA